MVLVVLVVVRRKSRITGGVYFVDFFPSLLPRYSEITAAGGLPMVCGKRRGTWDPSSRRALETCSEETKKAAV